ncbi:hypothetical protein DK847_18285 [Aestuariivirga litoralis]|uniref:Uncharacterized protein n=1 Tax=Aestuariivirga litoralis TaxID=2650924 RepID=A0A2W2BPZ0_9HYPH|nr:hypothetical protein [Aestuariivirga litoralis]PZF75466.1 hypothetical protein DK847_18285 [Aestuariivirga litoralis]
MKKAVILLVLVAAVLAVFLAYPLVNENTRTSCKALERRAVTLMARDGGPEGLIIAALARQLLRSGKGKIAAEFSRQRNPDIPVPLSCTLNYWHSLIDRDWLVTALQDNLN